MGSPLSLPAKAKYEAPTGDTEEEKMPATPRTDGFSTTSWVLTAALSLTLGAGCGASQQEQKPDPAVTEAPAEPAGPPPLKGEQLDLERIFADPPLHGTSPTGVMFSPDARWLTFLKGSEADSQVLDLWGLALTDDGQAASEARPLVKTSDLVPPDKIELSEEERMANERKRVRSTGITSYAFCGKTGDKLLFPLSGQLYVVDIAGVKDGGVPKVEKLTDKASARLDPRCSPQGAQVSFVEGGDLFVVDTKTKKQKQLTKGATATRTFGVAEFVAQEEMGRYDAHWWAPDEKRLAYLEVDAERVGVKIRPRIYADRTEMYEQRYPAAGEKNAIVKLHVLDTKTKKDVVVSLPAPEGDDPFDYYVPRAGFTPAGKLWVQWQNRAQTEVKLLVGEAPAYKLTELLSEKDEAWVELHDDLRFFEDGSFLWPSEKTGTRNLALHGADGKLQAAITLGADPVTEVVAVDEEGKQVYFVRATDRSRQRHLFVTSLAGGDAGPAHTRQLTQDEGHHGISAAPKGRFFVDTFSAIYAPPRVTVHNSKGEQVFVLDDNPTPEWDALAKPTPELVELKAEDGTDLNGLLIPPVALSSTGGADGQHYPVMTYVYGGPHAQIVQNSWSRLAPLTVFLAQRGIGTFIVDNRGSGNRSRAFTRSIKNRFGDIEVIDQKAAAAWLKNVPWVDDDHIGVFGWSYGGYMSLLLVLEPDSPFAAAVSVAPVSEWRLYDTHYTERYIGTPQGNKDVYDRSAVVPRAGRLNKPLLLMHGMADDNVLFENSLALMEAFQGESLPFELMVYPGRAHGLRGRGTQLHVYRSLWNFFSRELCTELNGGCRLPEAGASR